MAKRAKRPTAVVEVPAGADPYGGNMLLSRKLGTVLGCVCLLFFILLEELWIGSLIFGIGFTAIFCLEVFYEKSRIWYASFNLYLALTSFVLTYVEYAYGILSNLLKL